jgi:hypothetical protein
MTVRELIELLQQYDGDREVWMQQNGGEYHSSLEFLRVEEVGDDILYLID